MLSQSVNLPYASLNDPNDTPVLVCLYYKQKNVLLLVDMEFPVLVLSFIFDLFSDALTCEISSGELQYKFHICTYSPRNINLCYYCCILKAMLMLEKVH